MKLAIFGATGLTGQELVREALSLNHGVTALARDAAKLSQPDARVQIVPGDVRDAEKVAQTITGADAVVSALGQTRPPSAGLLTQAMKNIVSAMQQQGVSRLIYLTGAGVRDPQDAPDMVRSLIVSLMQLVAREVLVDSENAYAAVTASPLAWTVVRAPMLSVESSKGALRAVYQPVRPVRVARGDLAKFMLSELTRTEHIRRSPFVTY